MAGTLCDFPTDSKFTLSFILKKLQKNKKVIRCVCCVKKEKEKRQQKGDKL